MLKKRLALREFVQGQEVDAPLSDLLAEFSRPVVNYFIDQGALLIFEKKSIVRLSTLKTKSRQRPWF